MVQPSGATALCASLMENMFIGIPKRSWGHSKAAVGGNRPN
jgi:hypothetical protein